MAEEDLLSAARRVCRYFNIDMNKGGLITEHTELAMEVLDREWRKEADKRTVTRFAEAILHGDDEHREWLLEAAQAWNEQRPLPPPRGKGTK